MSDDKIKIGVYVCHCGGNISDVVDVKKVAEVIGKDEDVYVSKDFIFMCSDAGQKMIEDDIKEKGLNRIIVASCSPTLHEKTFQNAVERANLNKYLFEHINIREQDSWVSSNNEAATEKAIRLIRGGIAKIKRRHVLEKISKNVVKRALVVGAGLSGLITARDLARKGHEVVLVEKSPFIGGRILQWDRLFPYDDLSSEIMKPLIEEVANNPLIRILTNSEVVNSSGSLGKYTVTIKINSRGIEKETEEFNKIVENCPFEVPDPYTFGLTKRKIIYRLQEPAYPTSYALDWENIEDKKEEIQKWIEDQKLGEYIKIDKESKNEDIDVGAIVIATGFDVYEPYTGEYGWEQHPNVITLPQFIQLMKFRNKNEKKFIFNGKEIKSVAFIHCVGSRQIEGENKPGKHGKLNKYCSRYCCTATLSAENELKEYYPDVNIYDFYRDIRTYGLDHEDIYMKASKNEVIFLRFNNESRPEVQINEEKDKYNFTISVKDQLSYYEEVNVVADLIVLSVGMMSRDISDLMSIFSLPKGSDGFLLEAHPKLRPVETSSGIFLSGTAQGPMDSTEAATSASAAAAKVAELLSKDKLELSPFVARIDIDKCEGTGACVEACQYNAITMQEMVLADGSKAKRAKVDPFLCVGGGTCVPACPNHAITIQGWTNEQLEAMVEAMLKEVEE